MVRAKAILCACIALASLRADPPLTPEERFITTLIDEYQVFDIAERYLRDKCERALDRRERGVYAWYRSRGAIIKILLETLSASIN